MPIGNLEMMLITARIAVAHIVS